MRRRLLMLVVLLAVVAVSALLVRRVRENGVSQLVIGPADAQVQECNFDGVLNGSVEVFNSSRRTANLYFVLEFDWSGQDVGDVQFIARHVRPGFHAIVTDSGTADPQYADQLLARQPSLTCKVSSGAGGGVSRQ